MPELPEVETVRRGLEPLLVGQRVREIIVRQPRLRWPVPGDLDDKMRGQKVVSVQRRAKYLLLRVDEGTAVFHLGMSGSLRFFASAKAAEKHDHVDLVFNSGAILRLHDPRRFGALLWVAGDPLKHKLLADLGPEPLQPAFCARYLRQRLQRRSVAIKQAIMNSHIVVGVGNIYANEALFVAQIDPRIAAQGLSLAQCDRLVRAIKKVLRRAIKVGGTTLRDFVNGDGEAGYFQIQLKVYGRQGQACPRCSRPLKKIVQAGRSTFFCPACQAK